METVTKLSLSQRIALGSVQSILAHASEELEKVKTRADQAMLQWRAVMVECGLDLAKTWRISGDGSVEEVITSSPTQKRMTAPPPQNGEKQEGEQ